MRTPGNRNRSLRIGTFLFVRGPALLALIALGACARSARPAEPPRESTPAVTITRQPAAPTLPEPAGDRITIVRTACYGWCPVFTVTLHGSGLAQWHGEQHVAAVGDARAAIDPVQVEALVAAIDAVPKAGVPTTPDVGCGTDLGMLGVTFTKNGIDHSVWVHDGFVMELCDDSDECKPMGAATAKRLGLSMDAMKAVSDVADRVVALAPVAAWIGPVGR